MNTWMPKGNDFSRLCRALSKRLDPYMKSSISPSDYLGAKPAWGESAALFTLGSWNLTETESEIAVGFKVDDSVSFRPSDGV